MRSTPKLCLVLNATFDGQENRWKALELQGMFCGQKFAKNVCYHELVMGLRHLGYAIENNRRNFEITDVRASMIARFSKGHQQTAEEAQKRIERDRGDANTIRRQDPKLSQSSAERGFTRRYRAAVKAAAKKHARQAIKLRRPGDSGDDYPCRAGAALRATWPWRIFADAHAAASRILPSGGPFP